MRQLVIIILLSLGAELSAQVWDRVVTVRSTRNDYEKVLMDSNIVYSTSWIDPIVWTIDLDNKLVVQTYDSVIFAYPIEEYRIDDLLVKGDQLALTTYVIDPRSGNLFRLEFFYDLVITETFMSNDSVWEYTDREFCEWE